MTTTKTVSVYRVTRYEVDIPLTEQGHPEHPANAVIGAALQAPIRKNPLNGRHYMWCPYCGGPVIGLEDGTDYSRLVVNLHDHLNRCSDSPVKVERVHPSTAVVLAGDALEGTIENGYDPDRGDDISGFACPVCYEIVADAEGIDLHAALKTYLEHTEVCGTENEA